MDLKSGYRQIDWNERDHKSTVFITPERLHELKSMPSSQCGAPTTFERGIDTQIAGVNGQTSVVCVYDVAIFTRSFHKHFGR